MMKNRNNTALPLKKAGRPMGKRALFFILLLCLFNVSSVARGNARPLKIVAGTSLIEDVVLDLTDGQAKVQTLIPGSSCPGHNDVKTSDFVFMADADLVLLHPFQRTMPQVAAMVEAVHKASARIIIIDGKGSWLIPENQKRAARDIAAILIAAAPERTRGINARLERRLGNIEQAETASLAKLASLKNIPVVACAMQAEFLRWAGLDVVETYNRAEEMTPRDVANLIDLTRGRGVAGVVDNYQSGARAGLPLALELKTMHLVLSNFPGSSDDAPDYVSLLRHNVRQLARLAR
jgi:zinc transport system substrate-binding protein